MKESYLWQTLRKGLPRVHWTRVESTAGSGVPDVNGYVDGFELWLELKIMRGSLLEFRSSQIAWISRRLAERAANVFVLARKDDSLLLYPASIVKLEPHSYGEASVKIRPNEPLVMLHKPFPWGEMLRACYEYSLRGGK